MTSYFYRRVPFSNLWAWFADENDKIKRADIVNVFSYQLLPLVGFTKKVGWTTVVRLDRDIDQIRASFRKKFINEQIDRGYKNNIQIKVDAGHKDFSGLYRDFRLAKNLANDRYSVISRTGRLFTAYYGSHIVAGGIFIEDKQYMRALVLASKRLDKVTGRERDIIGQANRMIIWEAIKYAKTKGLVWVDLGGINPNSDKPADISLCEFKEGFGGERINTYYYHKVYSRWVNFYLKLKKILKPYL